MNHYFFRTSALLLTSSSLITLTKADFSNQSNPTVINAGEVSQLAQNTDTVTNGGVDNQPQPANQSRQLQREISDPQLDKHYKLDDNGQLLVPAGATRMSHPMMDEHLYNDQPLYPQPQKEDAVSERLSAAGKLCSAKRESVKDLITVVEQKINSSKYPDFYLNDYKKYESELKNLCNSKWVQLHEKKNRLTVDEIIRFEKDVQAISNKVVDLWDRTYIKPEQQEYLSNDTKAFVKKAFDECEANCNKFKILFNDTLEPLNDLLGGGDKYELRKKFLEMDGQFLDLTRATNDKVRSLYAVNTDESHKKVIDLMTVFTKQCDKHNENQKTVIESINNYPKLEKITRDTTNKIQGVFQACRERQDNTSQRYEQAIENPKLNRSVVAGFDSKKKQLRDQMEGSWTNTVNRIDSMSKTPAFDNNKNVIQLIQHMGELCITNVKQIENLINDVQSASSNRGEVTNSRTKPSETLTPAVNTGNTAKTLAGRTEAVSANTLQNAQDAIKICNRSYEIVRERRQLILNKNIKYQADKNKLIIKYDTLGQNLNKFCQTYQEILESKYNLKQEGVNDFINELVQDFKTATAEKITEIMQLLS